LLPVQLLDDVPLGEQLDVIPAFAVLVVVCQAHPTGRESAHDDRQQGTSHDSSSERTGASDPSGNKDVEGEAVCDRLEEHYRKGGALRGGGREAARRPQRHEPVARTSGACQCRNDTIRRTHHNSANLLRSRRCDRSAQRCLRGRDTFLPAGMRSPLTFIPSLSRIYGWKRSTATGCAAISKP